jgi:hypothetical protein
MSSGTLVSLLVVIVVTQEPDGQQPVTRGEPAVSQLPQLLLPGHNPLPCTSEEGGKKKKEITIIWKYKKSYSPFRVSVCVR